MNFHVLAKILLPVSIVMGLSACEYDPKVADYLGKIEQSQVGQFSFNNTVKSFQHYTPYITAYYLWQGKPQIIDPQKEPQRFKAYNKFFYQHNDVLPYFEFAPFVTSFIETEILTTPASKLSDEKKMLLNIQPHSENDPKINKTQLYKSFFTFDRHHNTLSIPKNSFEELLDTGKAQAFPLMMKTVANYFEQNTSNFNGYVVHQSHNSFDEPLTASMYFKMKDGSNRRVTIKGFNSYYNDKFEKTNKVQKIAIFVEAVSYH